MTDKNGRIIYEDAKCIVNDGQLGVVTEIKDNEVAVLVLSESGSTCAEQLFDPKKIEIQKI